MFKVLHRLIAREGTAPPFWEENTSEWYDTIKDAQEQIESYKKRSDRYEYKIIKAGNV